MIRRANRNANFVLARRANGYNEASRDDTVQKLRILALGSETNEPRFSAPYATRLSRLLLGKVDLEFAVGVAERREVCVDL